MASKKQFSSKPSITKKNNVPKYSDIRCPWLDGYDVDTEKTHVLTKVPDTKVKALDRVYKRTVNSIDRYNTKINKKNTESLENNLNELIKQCKEILKSTK